jgi:MFS family permease
MQEPGSPATAHRPLPAPRSLRALRLGATLRMPSAPRSRTGRTSPARISLGTVVGEFFPRRAALAIQEEFLVPFGIALGAGAGQAGLLASAPRLLAALAQLGAPHLEHLRGTRRVLVGSALVGAIAFLGAASVLALPAGMRVWALMGWSALVLVALELPNPTWGSWMGTVVPRPRRGRYLALRTGVGMPAAIGVFLAGGLLLDVLSGPVGLAAFTCLLSVGAALQFTSAWLLRRLYEPRPHPRDCSHEMAVGLRGLRSSRVGRFSIASGLLVAGSFVAGPYIAVFQLRELGFSYLDYAFTTVVFTLSSAVALRWWGRFADRRGDAAAVRFSTLGIITAPLLWALVHEPWQAVPAQVISGVAWAGFNLCALSLLSREGGRERRAGNVAVYNALSGVGAFAGAGLSGLLLPLMGPLAGSGLVGLFYLSTLLRAGAVGLVWLSLSTPLPSEAPPEVTLTPAVGPSPVVVPEAA